jgi:hypothetical protein
MNNPAVLAVVLLLVLAVLIGNTMIAMAFLRARKSKFRGLHERDREALDELHRRVQELPKRRG